MQLSQQLITDFNAEAENTKKVLQAVPEKDLAFQPHAKSWTLAQLAGHVAEGPAFTHALMEPELNFEGGGGWKPFIPKTRAELLATCERVAKDFGALLKGRTDAFLSETWTMRNGDTILWQAPRHTAVRSMAIHHTIHHRGQLEVYLRLCGAPLPPIYGPTADAPAF